VIRVQLIDFAPDAIGSAIINGIYEVHYTLARRMTNAHFIPPKRNPPTPRAVAIAVAVGAVAGAVAGLAAWALTDDATWFYAVPIGALVGAWLRRLRPNVIWGQNAQ
jgi:hypothetical protein